MKSLFLVSMLLLTGCGKTASYSTTTLPQGPKGDQGLPGLNGTSCSVGATSTGAVVVCTDGTYAFINNGVDGQNGSDGQDAPTNPYDIVAIIDPCGDNGAFDEVLLKMNNGMILAHYSDGTKQFMTLIGPGSYSTTDGHACNFAISNSGVVTW